MIITSREELNEKLWTDYLNYKGDAQNQCFIYSYTKKKKDERAEIIARNRASVTAYEETAKRDKYTLLRSAYLAYCNGVIPEEDYLRILRNVAGISAKSDKNQPKDGKNSRKVSYIRTAEKYNSLSGREAIDAVQKQWEKALLKGSVSDFFHNLGYKVPREETGSTESRKKEKSKYAAGKEKHVYGDSFDLLFQFQIYSSQRENTAQNTKWNPSAAILPDDAYIRKSEALFRQLNREEMTDVVIPLFCDQRSGGGVYIIGLDEIYEQEILLEDLVNPGSCIPCVIYYSDISSIDMDQITFDMTVETFNTVKEAFDSYTAKACSGAFFENYAIGNEDRGYEEAPGDIDPLFRPFFQKAGNRRMEIIRQEAQAEKEARALEEKKNRAIRQTANYTAGRKNPSSPTVPRGFPAR